MLIFALTVHYLPLAIGPIGASLRQVSPRVEEAARGLGRRPAEVFRTITAPLVRGGILAGAALVFLHAIKELPATLILAPIGFRTLATEIWNQTTFGFYEASAIPALILLAVAAVPLYLLSERGQRVSTVSVTAPPQLRCALSGLRKPTAHAARSTGSSSRSSPGSICALLGPGLRQDDHAAADRRARAARRRDGSRSATGSSAAADGFVAARATPDRDGVPGLRPLPPPRRRRQRRLRARPPPRPRPGRRRCSSWSASARSPSAPCTSSPAASSSGSPWPGRWRRPRS